MRAGAAFWLTLSGCSALGFAAAALGLGAHAAALGGLAVLPATAFAALALLTLARAGLAGPLTLAATPPAPAVWGGGAEGSRDAPEEPILPVIAFSACPVVSVADGRPVAAVAIEPNFRLPDDAYVTPEAVAWDRVAPALAARLDATLLERAAARAAAAERGNGEAVVIVSVTAGSLRETAFLARLAAVLDGGGGGERAPGRRARVVVLVRGAPAEAAGLIAGLPRSWRERLGLQLTSAPADEAELESCLAAQVGCLEVPARLLLDPTGGDDAAERTTRLLNRIAATNVPVLVSGVVDQGVLRRLRAYPVLFARGPVFSLARDLAAA